MFFRKGLKPLVLTIKLRDRLNLIHRVSRDAMCSFKLPRQSEGNCLRIFELYSNQVVIGGLLCWFFFKVTG